MTDNHTSHLDKYFCRTKAEGPPADETSAMREVLAELSSFGKIRRRVLAVLLNESCRDCDCSDNAR